MGQEERANGDTLSSVRNAARLLKEFTATDRELGVSELARRLGLGKSTVYRLLSTLTAERLLERGPNGRYRLGMAAHGVTIFCTPTLIAIAASVRPIVRR